MALGSAGCRSEEFLNNVEETMWRIFNRWTKSAAMTAHELAVLRLLLPAGNAPAELLFKQAREAPYVERKLLESGGYEVIIPYVMDESWLIECDANVASPTVQVATMDGIQMTFSTTILRGGFLQGLRGMRLDGGAWIKHWKPDLSGIKPQPAWHDWVPAPLPAKAAEAARNALRQWSGVDEGGSVHKKPSLFRVTSPASLEEMAACEQRLKVQLGLQYREFVSITNGCTLKARQAYDVLGTRDIDFVGEGNAWLGVTPLHEAGYIALQCRDGLVSDECFLLSEDGSSAPFGDLKQLLRHWLAGKKPGAGR